MSEESSNLPFDSAQGKLANTFAKATVGKQGDNMSDEFLREEIGCCPRERNGSLGKGISPPLPNRQGVEMTNALVRIYLSQFAISYWPDLLGIIKAWEY